ncbi:MAG: DNA translocase FtsK 4TM domain-containing protein [Kiritimatiellia bacterium]
MPPPPPDNAAAETSVRRRLIGFFMLPIALFPFLALFSYNWHDVPTLCIPPAEPTSNLIGAVGTWFAYVGYQTIGLAIWFVPLICVFTGILLVIGCPIRLGRRALGLLLFIVASTCLLQLTGHLPAVAGVLHALNITPNAGGAVGYLIMTRGLANLLSPFGAGVLMICLMAFSVLFTIGFRNIVALLARLTAWASDAADVEPPEDALDLRGDSIDAARAAREEAKAQRLAEKQRIAEEKAAAKAAKAAAREELQQKREAERLRKEEERRARDEARARLREQQQADLTASLVGVNATTDWLRPREAPSTATRPRPATPPPVAPAAAPILPVRSVNPQPPSALAPTAAPLAPAPEEAGLDKGPYELPPATLLHEVPPRTAGAEDPSAMAQRLIETLKVFDVNAQLAYYIAGPVVTQYALSLELGTRVGAVSNLSRDLQMALQATSIRIEAPIPGKNAVGIEVPNAKPASVFFREIYDGELWQKNSPGKFQVPLLLGKDAAGNDLVVDLAKLPHLLVAGATGQGKSVCLNSIINGLLMCRTPEQLKLIMVDPKRVEFTAYNRLPHLLVPIINDTKKVVFALRAAVVEMERRLKLFSRAGCRNIVDFNTRKTVTQPDMFGGGDEVMGGDPDIPRTIPYIVIIIDEVADIMQAAKKEVEPVIARLTALARAAGIHLILATQRPDASIITGVIKSNIPGRIAFKTSSSIDSRTILDATGSELLIGKGDMLFKMTDGRLLRAQGSYISDEEINNIVNFIGEHATVQFDEKLTRRLEKIKKADPDEGLDADDAENGTEAAAPEPLAAPTANGIPAPAGMTQGKEDALYRRALEVLRDTKRASISHFQRRMGIGYNHAARIVDLLEERGVIGVSKGAGPREIIQDPEAILLQMDGAAAPTPDAPLPDAPPPPAADDDPFGFPPES